MGYHRAGFDVIGIDLDPQPNYPFPFIRADALAPPLDLTRFDVIHASPPCQHYSKSTAGTGDRDNHPDLVPSVRAMLDETGVPYVIENVPGAPLRPDMTLCGQMFGLEIRRHRIFEFGGWWTMQHGCSGHPGRVWDVTGNPGGHAQVRRPKKGLKYKDLAHVRELMGMPWASRRGCTEAIPPVYTEHIGSILIEQLGATNAKQTTMGHVPERVALRPSRSA